MGNQASDQIKVEPVDAKLQNGAPSGHVSILSKDMGEAVACEAAVQQNSELPSLPTKEASPPSENEVDGGRNHTKGTPPVPESVELLSFSNTVSPSTDAPEDSSQQPVSIKASVEEEASLQCPKPTLEKTTVFDSTPKEEEPNQKGEKKAKFFDKIFKKNKSEIEAEPTLVECNSPPEDQAPSVETQVLTNGLHSNPGDLEGTTTAGKASEGPSPNGSPAGGEALVVDGETILQVDTEERESLAEDSPVMNFFKTLVSSSKTPKEEGAPPAVPVEEAKGSEEPALKAQAATSPVAPPAGPSMAEPKAPVPSVKLSVVSPFSKLFRSKQSSKGAKPETTTKAIQEVDASMASKVPKPPPPPPPPEPPKLEVKVEIAPKVMNSAQKQAPKDAAKKPEAANKQKPAKGSPFLKLFHPKEEEKQEEEVPEPVEKEVTEMGDLFKATDLRVPAGQSPKEKKSGKSNLISLFKPMTPDTKAKEGTSVTVPAVAPDTAQAAAAKAEPKPAAEAEKKRIAKQEAVPADGKPVSGTSQSREDDTSSLTRRLEKRNSIHMFFKNLAPKWQSDAEVQTDPVTIIYPAK